MVPVSISWYRPTNQRRSGLTKNLGERNLHFFRQRRWQMLKIQFCSWIIFFKMPDIQPQMLYVENNFLMQKFFRQLKIEGEEQWPLHATTTYCYRLGSYGRRVFSISDPMTWNSSPRHLCVIFKRLLPKHFTRVQQRPLHWRLKARCFLEEVSGNWGIFCVNNLPKVVIRQCPDAESNLRLWVTSGLQVRHVTVRLPSHTESVDAVLYQCNIMLETGSTWLMSRAGSCPASRLAVSIRDSGTNSSFTCAVADSGTMPYKTNKYQQCTWCVSRAQTT